MLFKISLLVALATVVLGRSLTKRESDKCVIPQNGTHTGIDLNELLRTEADYFVGSLKNLGSAYAFNVCGQTILQDSICTSGAAVCELEGERTINGVFGFLDTAQMSWVAEDDSLKMSMTGSDCPHEGKDKYTASIYFHCSGQHSAGIRSESVCNVEIDFLTRLACASPVDALYKCKKGACEVNDKGKYSLGDCMAKCADKPQPDPNPQPNPPPPPAPAVRYFCHSNFTCGQSETGPFSSSSSCANACQPVQKHYSCFNGQCVHDSTGPYLGDKACSVACQPFTCSDDYQCVPSETGSFPDHDSCMTKCSKPTPPPYPPPPPAPPGPKYSCFGNFTCHIVEEGGAFSNEQTCLSVCSPFGKTYSCINGRCVHDPRGIYHSGEECHTACSESDASSIRHHFLNSNSKQVNHRVKISHDDKH